MRSPASSQLTRVFILFTFRYTPPEPYVPLPVINEIGIIRANYPLSLNSEVMMLSLIACTSNCVYQQDGYCSLERAVSGGLPCPEDPCVNFIPRRASALQNSAERLPDIADRNDL